MRKLSGAAIGALVLGGSLAVRALAGPNGMVDDGGGPDNLLIATSLEDHRVVFHQHDDRPGGGCIVSRTRLEVCVPGDANALVPPDPCRGGPIAVRVEAHDEAVAHAAGLLGAIAVASGQDIDAVLVALRQAGLDIESMSVAGGRRSVPPPADAASLSSALVDLVSAALVADRPGGGCLQTRPLFTQGATALGLGGSCQIQLGQ